MKPAAQQADKGSLLTGAPFWTLRVSVRDNPTAIVDAAGNPSLTASPETVDRARAQLTNPRARVAAEVGWLPGVAPSRATQLANELVQGTLDRDGISGLPATARANLLLAQLQVATPRSQADQLAVDIAQAITAIEAIDPAALLVEINEDRLIAACPPVRNLELVQSALGEHSRQYFAALRAYLDQHQTDVLVAGVTSAVTALTRNGEVAASEPLQALIDAYEIEAQTFLDAEAGNIRRLSGTIVENGAKGEAHVMPAIDRLLQLLTAWDAVAQPMQLVARSRGQRHEPSASLARDVRNDIVELVNQHNLVGIAAKVTETMAVLFAELAEFHETVAEDLETLSGMQGDAAERAEADEKLRYSAYIGIGRSLLSINRKEIVWNGDRFPIDQITGVRWGATRHSVNGIPTGTTHRIAFIAGDRSAEVTTGNKQVYAEFTDRLWRTAGVKLTYESLHALKDGKSLRVGGIVFRDGHVTLMKSRLFKPPEVQEFSWWDVTTTSDNGQFIISSKTDRKFQAQASYQDTFNTHVLSNMISFAFKKGAIPLSSLL